MQYITFVKSAISVLCKTLVSMCQGVMLIRPETLEMLAHLKMSSTYLILLDQVVTTGSENCSVIPIEKLPFFYRIRKIIVLPSHQYCTTSALVQSNPSIIVWQVDHFSSGHQASAVHLCYMIVTTRNQLRILRILPNMQPLTFTCLCFVTNR